MNKLKFFCLVTIPLLAPVSLWGVDELVLVQAVSASGKTFVIRRGVAEGVNKYQQSFFTNQGSSFAAVAIDVNRHYSLWKIEEGNARIPFAKRDRIIFTRGGGSIWAELPKIADGDWEKLHFRPYQSWVLRFHYGLSLGESISSIEGGRYRDRQSLQFEGVYAKRFRTKMDWRAGLRWDREVSRLFSPTVDSIVHRYLAVGEINYYFEGTEVDTQHYYVGAGGGWGACSTSILNLTQWGTCLAFPMVRLGYEHRKDVYAWIFELSVDSIYSRESLPGGRGRQTLNVVNSRLTFGIKF